MKACIEPLPARGRFECTVLADEPEQAKALSWYLPYFGFKVDAKELRPDGIALVCELSAERSCEEWAFRVEDFEAHVRRYLKRTKPRPFSAAEFREDVVLFDEAARGGETHGI